MDFTFDTIKERLTNLGYTVNTTDEAIINFIISKTIVETKKMLNTVEIDSDLNYALIDTVCGEFLFNKKSLSPSDFFIDLSQAISSIEEGDTKVQFGSSVSAEDRLNALIEELKNSLKKISNKYRSLTW